MTILYTIGDACVYVYAVSPLTLTTLDNAAKTFPTRIDNNCLAGNGNGNYDENGNAWNAWISIMTKGLFSLEAIIMV